jgi:hypothetical protein
MLLAKRVKKRKKYAGGSLAHVDRVIEKFTQGMEKAYAAFVKSERESNEAFKKSERESNKAFKKSELESNEAFKKSELESNEAFKKSERESNEAFKKSEQEANEAFRKKMEEITEAFKKSELEANEAFRKEIHASLAASDKRLEEDKKDWNKKMGEIYNRLGVLAEWTFVPEAVLEKFQKQNYNFDNYCRRECIFGKDGRVRAEYDIVLRNGDTVAIVEIKLVFKNEYIDHFIDQLSVATDEKYKGKKIIAAIAALEIPKEVKKYAMSKGLYVIEQTGEEIRIETLDGKFQPRIW